MKIAQPQTVRISYMISRVTETKNKIARKLEKEQAHMEVLSAIRKWEYSNFYGVTLNF